MEHRGSSTETRDSGFTLTKVIDIFTEKISFNRTLLHIFRHFTFFTRPQWTHNQHNLTSLTANERKIDCFSSAKQSSLMRSHFLHFREN